MADKFWPYISEVLKVHRKAETGRGGVNVTVLPFCRTLQRSDGIEKIDVSGVDVEAFRKEARSVIRLCYRLIRAKEAKAVSPRARKEPEFLDLLMNDIEYLEDLIAQNERFLAETAVPSSISA